MLTLLCIATYRKGDEFLKSAAARAVACCCSRRRNSKTPIGRARRSTRSISCGATCQRRTSAKARRTSHEPSGSIASSRSTISMSRWRRCCASICTSRAWAKRRRGPFATSWRCDRAHAPPGSPAPTSCTSSNEAHRRMDRRVPPPWVLKPRGQAAAIGIRKIASADQLWAALDGLGDARADYLLEQFVPGDVFHVDSLVFDRQVVFAVASAYGSPPMTVAHEGGIFVTRTLPSDDPLSAALAATNARVLAAFGLARGVSHTEFIRGHDGALLFLETSARVGGAFIVDVVEAATGVNLWREWARIEIAGEHGEYALPACSTVQPESCCRSRDRKSRTCSAYTDPEIVRRIRRRTTPG